ncbi:MAG: hypothetical protein IKY64_07515 [Bacteroidaceae bacterium]|nr:hypothetical protein [Bacteroidaceae bacterium]
MKSTKFLAALAGVAMFTACAEEDLFNTSNTSQQMNQAVGAKLVGTDVSILTDNVSATRYAGGNAKWESQDVIGLAWLLTSAAPDAVQSEGGTVTSSRVWSNHMYNTEDGNTWTTKGNIYEGYHFAYYPWTYMSQIGQNKKYQMNPAMKGAGAANHMSQTLYLSNRQFIDAESDLDKETNTLKSSFEMYQAVKFIQVTATADAESAFAKGGTLDYLQIDSVEINVGAGNNIFAEDVTVRAAKLPIKAEYPENATATDIDSVDNLNLANFRAALSAAGSENIWVINANSSTLARNVKKAGLKVSTNPQENGKNVNVYFNVLPQVADLNAENVTVKFHVAGGASFTINYDTTSEANQLAIESLVNAYKEGGILSTFEEVENGKAKKNLTPLKLSFELRAEDFVTDFSSISDIDEWTEAVDLVNALGRAEETFKIDSTIVFENSIYMPDSCQLTVKRKSADKDALESFMLKGHHENAWPENLKSIDIRTYVAENAVVENAHTVVARQIVNNGTLNIPAGGTAEARYSLGRKGYTLFNNGTINLNGMYAEVVYVDNREGRINLVYGGFVDLSNDKYAGEIAYIVKDKDVENPTRIQNVINNDNANGEALVNILTFDADNLTNDTFSFTKETEGTEDDEDPYNPSGSTDADTTFVLNNFEKVNLDIKNVVVKSSKEVTVNNVVMRGANASLTNVNVAGNLTVTDGGDVVCTTIGGNVVTDGNVTATTIVGTVTASKSLIKADNIGKILSAMGSTIKVKEAIAGITDATNCSIEAATINGDVTVTNSDITADKIVGNVTIKGSQNNLNVKEITGKVTIANGANITGTQIGRNVEAAGTVNLTDINIVGELENKGTTTVAGKAAAIGSIVNFGKLYANTDITVATISHEYNCLTEVKTESETVYNTIWYTVENGSNEKVGSTRKGAVEYKGAATVLAELMAAIAEGGDVTLAADVELSEALTISKDVVLNLNGKKVTSAGDAFEVTQGTLTITGNGTVEAGEGGAFVAVWANGGNVVIENGSFSVGTDAEGKCNDCIYAKGGTITINGGTYTHSGTDSTKGGAVVNAHNTLANSKVIVNGGTFTGYQIYETADRTEGRVEWNIL